MAEVIEEEVVEELEKEGVEVREKEVAEKLEKEFVEEPVPGIGQKPGSFTNSQTTEEKAMEECVSDIGQEPGNFNNPHCADDTVLCKVINPRQICLASFLNPENDGNVEASADGESSYCSCKSETPSVAEDMASNDIVSGLEITDHHGGSLDISKALLDEVDSAEVTDMILGNDMEGDNSVSFDSLRQLADTYLANSQRIQPRRGKRLKTKACDECDYKAKTVGDLIKHKKYKHGPSVYKCPVSGCSFTTKYPQNIRHHQTKHTQVRPHKCNQCSWSFKRKSQLVYHTLTHSEERPFACDQCDFRTKRNWVLTVHVSTVHSELRPFQCEFCGFRMKTRSDMNKHKRIHISDKNFICSHCNKTFSRKTLLKKHIEYMHDVKVLFPCTYKRCDRKFKTKYQLQKHIKVLHKGIKRFSCDICGHLYSSKSNLESHMVVHDVTDRPFQCPVCPFRGKEEMHVRSHVGSMHKHLRLYNCEICHVRFKDHHKLNQHLNTEKHRTNCRFTLPPHDSELKPDHSKCDSDVKDEGEPQIVTIKQEPVLAEDCVHYYCDSG